MCMKEEYKPKREQLEVYLVFLSIPRWQWFNSRLLIKTLDVISLFARYGNNLATINSARSLIKDIYF